MHYIKTAAVAVALASVSSINPCPAPPAIFGLAMEFLAVGSGCVIEYVCKKKNLKCDGDAKRDVELDTPVYSRMMARQLNLPPGVPQYNVDMCKQSLAGLNIGVSEEDDNTFTLTGVPSTCMVLATLFTDSGHPIPCGSDCLQYVNLSDADAAQLKGTLKQLDG
ncbi:hypothetical protein P154DRAFT_577791 [Amniculicola lignicola CBS 123094]|uniref:Uncharacterized protein n=1 Tax=Amniculicola lignicola CBS 123094 TaxID=1392246 RepID=A0A6A5WCN6_9PLEO|nr:hypothetical protein P154DRAFT_577791 [Amniculicola lignicola CBS 123094]